MADSTDAEYRTRYRGRPADVDLREDAEELDDEEGMMSIRLPIASSGEVRNEGDEPLTRAELKGMSQQVSDLQTGVFPDHGQSRIVPGASQYSQFEKLGFWADGEIEAEAAADGEDLLMATARMPDPETLPAATGEYRQMLAILKEQAKRGIPIDASIGWREDEDSPGGVDLMEASMVGIGADPRTSTEGGEALARAAESAAADVTGFVERAREILAEHESMTDDDTAEDGGTTEQDADASEAEAEETTDEERAPEDVGSAAFEEFVASHYEGADTADVTDALAEVGEYVGEINVPELAALVADVVDEDTGIIQDSLEDWMENEQETDEDEEEETQEGDHDDEEDEDDEQDVTTSDAETADLLKEVQALREEHEELRERVDSGEGFGDLDLEDADGTSDADESDGTEERDDDTDPDPLDGLGEYA